jgi:DNA-binding LacI/PurR family transcriptional regulator
MRTTIKDVAELAQVHPSTVSRVFSGNAKISQKTRLRVMQAARQLNFHPNAIARSLSMQRAHAVGMVIPYTHEEFFLDPFFPQVLRGMSTIVYPQGFRLTISGAESLENEPHLALDLLRSRQVDGIIVQASRLNVDTTTALLSEGLPFVLLGRPVKDTPAIWWVEVDAYAATLEAITHLVALGHRRIGFIGGDATLVVTLDRLQGYRQALRRARLPFDEDLVTYGGFQQDSGVQAAQRFVEMGDERPTAIYAANDLMAIGAMQALKAAGLRVPRDCSVVGSNDSEAASWVVPSLTSSRAPYYDLGCEAARALLMQLKDANQPVVKKCLPCSLIVRDSTAPPPDTA